MDDIVLSFFNLDVLRNSAWLLLTGARQTILLSLLIIPLGLIGGCALAVAANASFRPLSAIASLWVDLFRTFPPLVLLIFIYGALPFVGIELSSIAVVVIGFMLNTSAYYSEIFRAGINSIPKGQTEAARSTGLTAMQCFRYVVLPQAIRNVLPDLLGNTVEIVKLTSLASVVAMPELLYQARQAQAMSYNATPLVAAALIYIALLWPAVRLLSRLERRAVAGR